jgi:MoaA/NifB/PqqE/SkfB family radical SAM enzyme
MNYFEQICFASDGTVKNLLDGSRSFNLSDMQKRIMFKRHVEIVNLELSYKCNRKCDYCPVSFSNRQDVQRYMEVEYLEKICKELAEIRYENRISLNLYNEPLLDPCLEEKIALIRSTLPYTYLQFNSNGDHLNLHRLCQLADNGLNGIRITLHPPPNKIQAASTVLRRITKLFGNKLSRYFSSISTDNVFDIGSLNFMHKGVQIMIQWPNWRSKGSNRGGVLAEHISSSFVRLAPCERPFREFTIFYDGTVQPCCESFFDDNTNLVPVGNIRSQSIYEIYSSDSLCNFRKSVFDFGIKNGICASCTVKAYHSKEEDAERTRILLEL